MIGAAKHFIGRVPLLAKVARAHRNRRAMRALRWTSVPGHDFRMLGGNWFAAGNYAQMGGGLHEADEVMLVGDLLDGVDLLVDVGANSGLFSLLAASRGKRAIALEPMQDNLTILLRNIRHNDFASRIEVLPVGASDAVGLLPFYGSGQVASLLPGWGDQLRAEPVLVPVTTLDTLLHARLKDCPFLLKIDVEGAELAVLEGARALLDLGPALLIENSLVKNHPQGFNPHFEPIFRMLWAKGYTAHVADQARMPVSEAMLAGWVAARDTGLATENFLFLQ